MNIKQDNSDKTLIIAINIENIQVETKGIELN